MTGRRSTLSKVLGLSSRRRLVALANDTEPLADFEALPDSPFVLSLTGATVLVCDPHGQSTAVRFAARIGSEYVPFNEYADAFGGAMPLNYLANSAFDHGTACWKPGAQPAGTVRLGIDIHEQWTLTGGHTAFLEVAQNAAGAQLVHMDSDFGSVLPITEGQHYIASGHFGLHRCLAALVVEIIGSHGNVIHSFEVDINPDRPGGRQLSDYHHASCAFVAPQGATAARYKICHRGSRPDPAVPKMKDFIFATRLFFGPQNQGAGERWTPRQFSLRHIPALSTQARMFAAQIPVHGAIKRRLFIHVMDMLSGEELLGSPVELSRVEPVAGRLLPLEGHAVRGWARTNVTAPADFTLVIDGRAVASTHVATQDASGRHHFSFSIPRDCCDGRVHQIEVESIPSGIKVARAIEIVPSIATAWTDLQLHAGHPLPAQLDPIAARRYRGLLLQLDRVGQPVGTDKSAVPSAPELRRLHDVLVRGFKHNTDFRPLAFPVHAEPRVSVIIPVRDKFEVITPYSDFLGTLGSDDSSIDFTIIRTLNFTSQMVLNSC